MLDFLPWMDEVHIVEMGRNFLSSVEAMDGTILSQANGMPYIPLYYLGPMIQELLFRIFGEIGSRLSPLLAIVLSAISFSWFLKASNRYSRTSLIMTSLMALTLPLVIQSARLVRIDAWVFFTCFLTCGLLSRRKYKTAATIAALTPFIWPSAIMLFPMYLVVHLENSEKHTRLIAPALVALGVVALMLVPLIRVFQIAAGSLSSYFATYGGCFTTGEEHNMLQQVKGLLVPIAKETLRAPFFMLVAYTGMVLSITRRRALLLMFLLAVTIGTTTGMHTFRYIYLMPYFLLFAADATEFLAKKAKAFSMATTGAAVLYGVVSGPLAYMIADLRHSADESLSKTSEAFNNIPPGTRIFVPGYSTYYTLRKLGVNQVAIPEPGGYADENRVASLLTKCEYAFLESEDRYAAIEESYTLYGLLRDFCLEKARQENSSGNSSILGRIGEKFAYGTKPEIGQALTHQGFSEEVAAFVNRGRNYRLLKKTAENSLTTDPVADSSIILRAPDR